MISLFFVFFLLSEPFVTKIGILQPTMYLITLVSEPVRLTKPFLFITAETLSTPHQVWANQDSLHKTASACSKFSKWISSSLQNNNKLKNGKSTLTKDSSLGGIICTPKSTLNTLTLQTHPIHFKRYFLLCILFYMSKLSFIKIIPLTNYFLSTPIKYSQFLCHIALRNNSQSLLRFKIGVVTP